MDINMNSKSSNLGIDTQLKEAMATPFTLLFALYNAHLLLKLRGWKEMDLLKQCNYLQSRRINNKSKRKAIIDELIQGTEFTALKHKAYLRIRVKSVLAQFYRETEKLKCSNNISQWTGHDIIVSFIFHLIFISTQDESGKKAATHQKVWQFTDFLRAYFRDTGYNGTTFLAQFNDDKTPKNKGFGLKIMRNVCTKFTLKSGPYSKVKKQCNLWAIKLNDQYNGVTVQNKVCVANNKDKYVSTVAEIINEKKTNSNDINNDYSKYIEKNNEQNNGYNNKNYVTNSNDELNGKCWYWYCDYGGSKWIPYRPDDMEKLNAAWRNKEKSAVIKNGSYRVEFSYKSLENPVASQYNNSIANPNGRMVMCTKPQSTFHGISVETKPL